MKTHPIMEIQLQAFIISALDGGELSASRSDPLHLGKESLYEAGWAPEPRWTQWWRRNHCPCQKSNPSHTSYSLVNILTELPRLREQYIVKCIMTLLYGGGYSNPTYYQDLRVLTFFYNFLSTHLSFSIGLILNEFGLCRKGNGVWLLSKCREHEAATQNVDNYQSQTRRQANRYAWMKTSRNVLPNGFTPL
jgi:hypothetical protein